MAWDDRIKWIISCVESHIADSCSEFNFVFQNHHCLCDECNCVWLIATNWAKNIVLHSHRHTHPYTYITLLIYTFLFIGHNQQIRLLAAIAGIPQIFDFTCHCCYQKIVSVLTQLYINFVALHNVAWPKPLTLPGQTDVYFFFALSSLVNCYLLVNGLVCNS